MVGLKSIETLLNEASRIVKKYEAEAQESGSGFNFVSVIHEEKSESLHSRIITELINPQGSHGLGDIFLKQFFEKVLDEGEYCDSAKYIVKREHYTGVFDVDKENPENSKGGKIDIYIEVGDKKIAIENKIDAKDQEDQICRYYNYTNSAVYYLTLDGKVPTSCCNLKEGVGFKLISYQDNILKWLVECEKLAADKSELVVVIRQYVRIVKKLTGEMSELEEEINTLLDENSDFLKAAYDISNVIQLKKKKAKQNLFNSVFKELKDKGEGGLFVDKNDGLMKVKIGEYGESVLHWCAGVKNDFYSVITIDGCNIDEDLKLLKIENVDKSPNIIYFYGNQCDVNFNKLNTITPGVAEQIATEAISVIAEFRAKIKAKESN